MEDALKARISSYYEARAAYDAAKRASDNADAERRARERELIDYMIEHGIKSVSCDDGTTPSLVKQVQIVCRQDNAELIRKWLLETVGDDSDFTETVLSRARVLEHCKELDEQGVELPDFLQFNSSPGLRVNGWKGR